MPAHSAESPAKKQSKWSAEEDALIIELRGSGMKWDDISKRLPGRSAISCRLHYQNYLERRSEWDEERKNKLARLYERFKPDMWAKVAEEMQVPWRAAEAMHWHMGEHEMARRAGVTVPFTLSSAGAEGSPLSSQGYTHSRRSSPTRGHAHSQSQGSIPREIAPGPTPRFARAPMPMPMPGPPSIIPPPHASGRRETLSPHQFAPRDPGDIGLGYGAGGPGPSRGPPLLPGPGLAPIQPATGLGRGGNMLPGVAELTTGVSPYSTPAYSTGHLGGPSAPRTTTSQSSSVPSPPSYGSAPEPGKAKRRASPSIGAREATRRRHHDPGYD